MGFDKGFDFAGLSKILSPLLKGAGSVYQGYAGARGYSVEADALRKEAAYRRQAGAYKAGLVREQGREIEGTQKVVALAQGAQLEGSPLKVLANTAYKVERNALLTELAGETEARALEGEASTYERVAKLKKGGAWLKALTGLSKWDWKNKTNYKKRISQYDWDVTGLLR